MANEYYTSTGAPVQASTVASPAVRSQFTAIQTAFDYLPPMSTTVNKMWVTNSAGTGVTATMTVTPSTGTLTIGNGVTFTCNASSTFNTNSITLAGGQVITFTATNAVTFTTTGSTNVTLPTSGTLATTGGTVATATTATNVAGGAAGSVPYQTGSATTTMLAVGTAGQAMVVNSGATAPQWKTIAPTSYSTTAISKTLAVGEYCIVTATGVTLTLPASPTAGDFVFFYCRTVANDTIIGRNSSNIQGLAENMTVGTATMVEWRLTFHNATDGWVLG